MFIEQPPLILRWLNPDQYVGLKTKEIADIVHDRIQNKINENI